jgi:hypothetical protein
MRGLRELGDLPSPSVQRQAAADAQGHHSAFAGFDFNERADNLEVFSFRKAAQGFLLFFKPQARADA